MGGATSSTSKTVILAKAAAPITTWITCSAGLHRQAICRLEWQLRQPVGGGGLFAISAGLVDAARVPHNGVAVVRVWQANIGKTIIAHVPITDGAVQETGDFELDGVTFPAAEVQLEFMDPAAEEEGGGGSMFPTGNLVDDLEVPGVGTFKATLINAGIPTIFINAQDLGYTGTELQGAINSDPKALAMFETVRAYGALRMGLIKHLTKPPSASTRPRWRSWQACRLRGLQWQGDQGRRCGSAGARLVHGQTAPRDDGHRGGGDWHRRGDFRHLGQPRGRRRGTQCRALRAPVRHLARRRRGETRWTVNGW